MSTPALLVLDFDGVVCEGMREFFESSWRAWHRLRVPALPAARHDELEAQPGELAGEGLRLLAPALGERGVAVALPAPLRVPGRLRVADQPELGRHGDVRAPSRAGGGCARRVRVRAGAAGAA